MLTTAAPVGRIRVTLRGLMCLGGIEVVLPERFAEAFTARKAALAA
jgi:hypothetical protein